MSARVRSRSKGTVQGDWDARLGGNNLRDLERTPDLDERSSGNPRPGRVCFAPGVCSIPMPRGEGAPFNVTRCGEEDRELWGGGGSLMMHRVYTVLSPDAEETRDPRGGC